ncbi:MAG: hypothetical protein GC204_03675 [Chloroflexi bacterium]|nr:hypothetical protein [Chloroflexota bacterium]
MRIATWNLDHAIPIRRPALRAVMTAHPADIWVLTETHDAVVPGPDMVGVHSEQRPFESDRVRSGSRWASVWSRYPVIERVDCPDAERSRTLAVRLAITDETRLIVYATVLPWASDSHFRGAAAKAAEVQRQIGEWRALRQRFPHDTLCIAGDFNADMATGRVGSKERNGMLAQAFEDLDLCCLSCPGRLPAGLLPMPAVDHIVLSQPLTADAGIVAAWPADKTTLSDHSGLLAELPPAARRQSGLDQT